MDINGFENELGAFKKAFAKRDDLASWRFRTAIDGIDKSIDHLQQTKETLLGTDIHPRLANDTAQDEMYKKPTRSSPTMAERCAGR